MPNNINILKDRAKKLRSNQTDAEKKLWYRLRANRFENRKFYRQFVIEPYIVDFVQRDLKLVIELDGGQHSESKEKDDRRTEYLEKQGYQIVRFWNNELIENFDGVLSALSLALSQRERELKIQTIPNCSTTQRERELKIQTIQNGSTTQREEELKAEIIPTYSPEFAKRRAHRNNSPHKEIWNILDKVFDPELPTLTIWDLGILQDVTLVNDTWEISVTLTYSGCPAVDTINADIKTEMLKAGYEKVLVKVVLAPAWSTQMISPQGKAQLKGMNIAPPDENDRIECPICNSDNTKVISQFGSTACKSLCQCNDCSETFDYFKHF